MTFMIHSGKTQAVMEEALPAVQILQKNKTIIMLLRPEFSKESAKRGRAMLQSQTSRA